MTIDRTKKKPKVKVFACSKKDKEKAKITEKLLNYLIGDEDWEQMRKTIILLAIEQELNPLGLICVSWKK